MGLINACIFCIIYIERIKLYLGVARDACRKKKCMIRSAAFIEVLRETECDALCVAAYIYNNA